MNVPELTEDVRAQLSLLQATEAEIVLARRQRGGGSMSRFELAGFGALLMNFYGGVESILKRVCLFESLPLPAGPEWHAELFRHATRPMPSGAPAFFASGEAELLRDYRSFRHVMVHGYGVTLKWELMAHLVEGIEGAQAAITAATERYVRFHSGPATRCQDPCLPPSQTDQVRQGP